MRGPAVFRRIKSLSSQPLVIVTFAALSSALPMQGQAQSPTPPVATRVSATVPSGQQQAPPEIATIRAYTNIVVVDVVVTDSQGKAVHGLKKSDFSLFENNKAQNIRNFEEHSAATDLQVIPPPKLPPGLFTNRPPVPVNGPVNVLLLDYLNTPLTAQPSARKQLLDYLNHAPPGTRIAIFGLTTQLSMLQGFTSDTSVLKAALDVKKGGAPQASQILTDPVNGGAIGDNTLLNSLNSPQAVPESITPEIVDNITRFQALETSFEQDMRARYTLQGFDLLARYLVGIPGRKNVIWFSGSFPLDVEPNVNEQDPNDSVIRNDDELRKTDNLLTRAQVAVYPVDVRGVMTDPSQNFAAGPSADINMNSGREAADTQNSFLVQSAMEHETMMQMAEDTGGQAFINTNDLKTSVAKAIENGSNYYTLTYTPSNSQWDARFRAIKIKVEQPGVKLTYRNGYYAVDPNDRSKLAAGVAATAMAPPTTMATAMMHGGPEPSEILFKVRIRPSDAPPEATPLKTNQTNPDPKVKLEGPYKAYGVDLVPDPHAVSCRQEASGNRHCAIEVWTFVYDNQGQKLITASNRLYRFLTPTDYQQLLTGGMAFHEEVSVPVKGHYYLRCAIHDMVSDRVGAVEIPVTAVARLEPLQPLPEVPGVESTSPALPAAPSAPVVSTPTPAPPATPSAPPK
jgi:VWFA-related protein